MKKIVFISPYCYKSIPVRTFHAITHMHGGVEAHSIFFKDSQDNTHPSVTEREYSLLFNTIAEIKPELVAISILAPYAVLAKKISREIRKRLNIPIVVGGKYPTISTEKALAFADYACKGEGDLVLPDILERLKEGKDLRGIKGLWHKEAGTIVNNGQRRLLEDLDTLPFPSVGEPNMYFISNNRMLTEDPELYNPNIWIMTARGCAYECSYCVNSLLAPMNEGNGKLVRQRSPENVIAEIEAKRKIYKHPAAVNFLDEVFGTSFKWTESFTRLYKEKIGLPFFCAMAPTMIKEKNIELLADAGLCELNFGIQSGVDSIRNGVMNRPGTNKEMFDKIAILKKHKITPLYDLIYDNPFEDTAALRQTIELIISIPHPRKFSTFKMQFFEKYPFTEAALRLNHIRPEDLSDEKIAEAVQENWAYVPKISLFGDKIQLQNAIYLLCRNNYGSAWIAARLSKKTDYFLGFIACIYAYFAYLRYYQFQLSLSRFNFALNLLKSPFRERWAVANEYRSWQKP